VLVLDFLVYVFFNKFKLLVLFFDYINSCIFH